MKKFNLKLIDNVIDTMVNIFDENFQDEFEKHLESFLNLLKSVSYMYLLNFFFGLYFLYLMQSF